MNKIAFKKKLKSLQPQPAALIRRRNRSQKHGHGIFDRYEFRVLTGRAHPAGMAL